MSSNWTPATPQPCRVTVSTPSTAIDGDEVRRAAEKLLVRLGLGADTLTELRIDIVSAQADDLEERADLQVTAVFSDGRRREDRIEWRRRKLGGIVFRYLIVTLPGVLIATPLFIYLMDSTPAAKAICLGVGFGVMAIVKRLVFGGANSRATGQATPTQCVVGALDRVASWLARSSAIRVETRKVKDRWKAVRTARWSVAALLFGFWCIVIFATKFDSVCETVGKSFFAALHAFAAFLTIHLVGLGLMPSGFYDSELGERELKRLGIKSPVGARGFSLGCGGVGLLLVFGSLV
jgi:hypothetical protein